MAHIPDGILSAPVLIGGAVIAAAGVGFALRKMDDKDIPRMAILSAIFFAGSLVSIPVGPSSVHLLFTGLMGVMLGFGIFPAVLVALTLQAVLFGFGGLTTLGVNTVNIALPGAVLGLILGPAMRGAKLRRVMVLLGSAGAISALATGGMIALSLWLSASAYVPVARVLLVTYLPLAIAESVVAAAIGAFLFRVQPDALWRRRASLVE